MGCEGTNNMRAALVLNSWIGARILGAPRRAVDRIFFWAFFGSASKIKRGRLGA